MVGFLERSRHGGTNEERATLVRIMDKKEMEHRACVMIAIACLIHLTIFLLISTFILYAISSSLYTHPPELVGRNFSTLWTSAFMCMSAFTNCGFLLTSDALVSYHDKPGVYLFLCVLILAGNTSAPLFLRGIVRCMYMFADRLHLDRDGLLFALTHPRSISYYLFDARQTFMLAMITLSINVIEYVFFLASTMNRLQAQVSMCLCMYVCMYVCMHVCMYV
jgi:Trk-type K+ transport system membrane component